VDNTATAQWGALKFGGSQFDSGGARAKSATGLFLVFVTV